MKNLYPHQLEMVKSLQNGARYIVASPRTGKTRPAIEFLRDVENVLVLTKKAAVPGWHSELEALGVTGWTVTNYEAVRSKNWASTAVWGALVCDECHVLGRYAKPAETTKAVYKLSVKGPRIGISATPCAESYSQLFHQAKALKLNLWTEFKNFYAFFRVYGIPDLIRANGRMLETYKKVDERVWTEFSKFCCIVDRQKVVADFVEATDKLVLIDAPEVLELCNKLRRDGIIKIDGRNIVADSPLSIAQKCQQICSGWVLDDEGVAVKVHTIKSDWVRDNLKGLKTAVLTTYKAEVASYVANGFSVDVEGFKAGNTDRFVGNIQSYARGVDFSVADALVLTGCPWSSETFLQSRDRLLRRDRTREALVYYPVIKNGLDEKIYKQVAITKKAFTARLYLG